MMLVYYIYVYMLAIAGQTARPNGLNILLGKDFLRMFFYRIFFQNSIFLIPRATPGTAANIFYFVAKFRKGKKKYHKINKRVLRKRRH